MVNLYSKTEIDMIKVKEKIDILGIPVDKVTMEEALSIFQELLLTEETSFIVTPNSEIVMNAAKNKQLADLIKSADLVIPDGIGLVYASRILKQPLLGRVTGIDSVSYTHLTLPTNREM